MSAEQYFDSLVAHLVGLQRYAGGVTKEMHGKLTIREQNVLRIIDAELKGSKITTRAQRNKLLKRLKKYDAAFFKDFSSTLGAELSALVEAESVWAGTRVQSLLGAETKRAVSAAAVQRAFDRPLSMKAQSRTVRDLVDDIQRNGNRRTQIAVRRGFIEGAPMSRIIRELRGTKAFNYKDGLFDIDRREAELIARTSVNAVSNQVRDEVYEANDDIIDRVMWISTLDTRTSTYCQVQDGEIYKNGEGPRPPGHPNCRSSVMPLLRGETKLFGTRASRSGPVNANLTYQQWLRRQPAAVQDDVLGKTKGILFRRGKLPFEKFRSKEGRELTLVQLRRKEAALFKSLGI